MSYLSTDEAYQYVDLACWYQNSIDETQPPIWTDEHLEELLNDFYVIPKDTPLVDVVPKAIVNLIFEDIFLCSNYENGKLIIDHDRIVGIKNKFQRRLNL